jgi:CheY-like chemotaxis protein
MGGNVNIVSNYGEGSVFTAIIPQTILHNAPLAVVENPLEKSVLLFDPHALTAWHIINSLKNMGVPITHCTSEEDFFHTLENPGTAPYSFAFAGVNVIDRAADIIKNKALPTTLVLLATPKECNRDMLMITLPAYSIKLAGILNHWPIAERRKRRDRFIAPDAHILVVDDIQTNLTVAKGLMAIFNVNIDTCTSGQEAITMVKQKAYDIVFMDHMMPGMDGIETTELIREWEKEQNNNGVQRKQLPIIALTANAITGMKEIFLEHGFNDYVSKPIELEKLNAIMEIWIPSEKKLQNENAAENISKETARQPAAPESGQTGEIEGPLLFAGITVEGIDLEAGMERYHKAYLDILRSYCQDNKTLIEKLRSLPESDFTADKLKEYAITVHGLKGSSYGICANGMGKLAEFMEHTAKAGDAQTIKAQNGRFLETAERLLADLETMLKKISPAPAGPKLAAPDPALLQKLAEDCKHYKTNAMAETLAELEKYEYESGGDMIKWLREQMDNLEYDAILKRLS